MWRFLIISFSEELIEEFENVKLEWGIQINEVNNHEEFFIKQTHYDIIMIIQLLDN